MRVTIELPDELVRFVENVAEKRGVSLSDLVEQGLRRVLSEKPDASRLPKLPSAGREVYDLSNEEIESLFTAGG